MVFASRCLAILTAVLVAAVALSGCTATEREQADAAKSEDGGQAPARGLGSDPGRSGSGSRPHVHDYWYGADQLLLLEEAIQLMVLHNHLFDEPPREQHTHGCDETAVSDSQGGSVKFSLPPGTTVIPGTALLEFTAEWSDSTITGVHLYYRPAGRGHSDGHDHDLGTIGASRGSSVGSGPTAEGFRDGGVLTPGNPVLVPVAPHQVDDGHAVRSHWAFFLCADGPGPVALAEGAVDLSVIGHRADPLPLDPPHPDHWKGAARLHLGQAAFDGHAITVANKGEGGFLHVPLNASAIIPPGASRLVLPLHVSGGSPLGVDTTGFALYWKDPTVPGWTYRQESVSADDKGRPQFVIPVEEDSFDSVYATETDWDLYLRIRSKQHVETAVGDQAAPDVFEGRVHLDVWAERDG